MTSASACPPEPTLTDSPGEVDRASRGDGSFGVYVHIPFCNRRCDYCAFATWTDRHHLMLDYAAACRVEIRRAVAQGMQTATSVFLGGGTPSLLPPRELTGILADIPRTPDAEVTVECNPDTVDLSLLHAYRAAGVTRVSLGVQSMVSHVLASLGRTHEPQAVLRSVDAARQAGFTDFNIDLIYGAATEGDEDWRHTLETILELAPPHVSAYALTVEAGTPLADDPSRHPDDDTSAGRYLFADEHLAAAGLDNYEISNWARPGHECRHNLLYWRQGDYRGIGCAAHSHQRGHRWWNVRTPERYIAIIRAGASPMAAGEHLEDAARRLEGLQLSLRTAEGVDASALSAADRQELGGLGLIALTKGRVALTTRGRLLANEVATRLE